MGLRTQPCGLPVDFFSFDDVLLLDVTICFLSVRKLYAQLMILGFILVAASLSMSIVGDMVLKALVKSMNTDLT